VDRKKADGDDQDAAKKYKNNFVLSEAIEAALSKMIKDAYNDNSKKIPKDFEEFARCQQYKDLLEAMLDYNRVSPIQTSSFIFNLLLGTFPT
jgi:hypothetical protein